MAESRREDGGYEVSSHQYWLSIATIAMG
jgi:hypothetical protein